uniref:Molybdopterin synthase catalytic subunit n=1 Tax=Oncorhynchus tshawytscha TaxID=74940 RepID=A0A8C8CIJ8_ONCTS
PAEIYLVTHDNPSSGAISIFIFENNFEGKKVVQLEHEIYTDIRARWPTVRHICVRHRLERARVIIGISSPHRGNALEAVQFCIDTLKATVSIWKKKVYEADESCWKENNECQWTGQS